MDLSSLIINIYLKKLFRTLGVINKKGKEDVPPARSK
jgi:hypothetical protein